MSLVKSIRLTIKHLRRFVAGFASVPTFAIGRIKGLPFSKDRYALDQDRNEVNSDRELAAFKLKQHERQQK